MFILECAQSWRNKIMDTANNPAGIYLLKINTMNTRIRCEICSKLTIKTSERRQAFIVNFEHISHLILVFLLLTLTMKLPTGKVDSTCRCFRFLIITLIESLIANPFMQVWFMSPFYSTFCVNNWKSFLSKKASKSMICSLDERLVSLFLIV